MERTDARIVPRTEDADARKQSENKIAAPAESLQPGDRVIYTQRTREKNGAWTEREHLARVLQVRRRRIVIEIEDQRQVSNVRPHTLMRRSEVA